MRHNLQLFKKLKKSMID